MSKYSYHRSKVDANHTEIVKAFRSMGAYVLDTHDLKNCCDCIVNFRGQITAVEIKDGAKPLSQRKLKKGEQEFKDDWQDNGGRWALVETLSDVTLLLMP